MPTTNSKSNSNSNSNSNEKLLAAFLAYLKVEKGLARLSVSAYRSDLGQFAEFLEGRKRLLLAARREDVHRHLRRAREAGRREADDRP